MYKCDSLPDVDLIIDCTASQAVRSILETVLVKIEHRPPITAIAIDSKAEYAIGTLSMPEYSGGTIDLIRQLKIEACRDNKLSDFRNAFWPINSSKNTFEPEPGCSEPTFIGSDVDISILTARMLNEIAHVLNYPSEFKTGCGWLCYKKDTIRNFQWQTEKVLIDRESGYVIRISNCALREMLAWVRKSCRTVGPLVETGGLIFW